MIPAAGYSGTPLAKKLGVGPGTRVTTVDAPENLHALLDPIPDDVVFQSKLSERADVVLVFVTERARLNKLVAVAGRAVFPAGGVWICWPKRASGVPTDITEDVLREVILPTGLVDNKVCAVDATWSGLRFVWRKELRS